MLCLPAEVVFHISTFLPVEDRLQLRHCSRWMNEVILSGTTNPIHFEIQKGDILKTVLQRKNVFITGAGGVGKTVVMNALYRAAEARGLNIVTLAPTQMAAEHIPNGRTVHSFLHIKRTLSATALEEILRKYDTSGRSYPIRRVDLIMIDEVSMLGASLIHCMNRLIQHAWRTNVPFGGAQVVLSGDFCQLPPVCDKFCFTSPVWKQLQLETFELTVPLRHGGDFQWFHNLQDIRQGRVASLGDSPVQSRICLDMDKLLQSYDKRPVILSSDNKVVEDINRAELAKNPNPVEDTLHAYDSFYHVTTVSGVKSFTATTCPSGVNLDTFWRCPRQIDLKKDGRYICTMNLNKKNGLINGRACTYRGEGMIMLDNGTMVGLSEFFTCFNYMIGGDVLLRRQTVALRLGYAITIHKSQGMTLDKVVCDLRKIRCAGMAYVALSRVRYMDDIYLVNTTSKTKVPVSKQVLDFYSY